MLSIEKNFIFIHVRKTAGTSIAGMISKYSDEDKLTDVDIFEREKEGLAGKIKRPFATDKHTPLRIYRKHLEPEFFKGLYKFCSVRNPWGRMISHYFWKKQKNPRYESSGAGNNELFDKKEFMEFVPTVPPLEHYVAPRSIYRSKLFSSMINPLKYAPIDFWVRQERFSEDIAKLADELDLDMGGVPVKNASSHNHYSLYYDSDTIEMVRSACSHEVDFFEYEFDA